MAVGALIATAAQTTDSRSLGSQQTVESDVTGNDAVFPSAYPSCIKLRIGEFATADTHWTGCPLRRATYIGTNDFSVAFPVYRKTDRLYTTAVWETAASAATVEHAPGNQERNYSTPYRQIVEQRARDDAEQALVQPLSFLAFAMRSDPPLPERGSTTHAALNPTDAVMTGAATEFAASARRLEQEYYAGRVQDTEYSLSQMRR